MDNNDVNRERNSGKTQHDAMFAAHMQAEARRIEAANRTVSAYQPGPSFDCPTHPSSPSGSTGYTAPQDGAQYWGAPSRYDPSSGEPFLKFLEVSAVALTVISLAWVIVDPPIDAWQAAEAVKAQNAAAAEAARAADEETRAAIRQAAVVRMKADPATNNKIWVFGGAGPQISLLSPTEASLQTVEKWPVGDFWNKMPVTCKAHLVSSNWTINHCSTGNVSMSQ